MASNLRAKKLYSPGLYTADVTMVTQYTKHGCYYTYLKPIQVLSHEIIWRTTTPINYVLILTTTAQLSLPVSNTKVIAYKCITKMTIAYDGVKECLKQ